MPGEQLRVAAGGGGWGGGGERGAADREVCYCVGRESIMGGWVSGWPHHVPLFFSHVPRLYSAAI